MDLHVVVFKAPTERVGELLGAKRWAVRTAPPLAIPPSTPKSTRLTPAIYERDDQIRRRINGLFRFFTEEEPANSAYRAENQDLLIATVAKTIAAGTAQAPDLQEVLDREGHGINDLLTPPLRELNEAREPAERARAGAGRAALRRGRRGREPDPSTARSPPEPPDQAGQCQSCPDNSNRQAAKGTGDRHDRAGPAGIPSPPGMVQALTRIRDDAQALATTDYGASMGNWRLAVNGARAALPMAGEAGVASDTSGATRHFAAAVGAAGRELDDARQRLR